SGHKTATSNTAKIELTTSSNHSSTTTAPASNTQPSSTPPPLTSASEPPPPKASNATSTSSATTTVSTCTTSLNDNMPPEQQHQTEQQQQSPSLVTFTILIAIEKSQHLCVIDLISQSLRLLTRHIAHSHILAVCLDTGLIQSPKIVNSNEVATTNDDVKTSDIKSDKTSATTTAATATTTATIDTNGNWRCQKTHTDTPHSTLTYIGVDEVTAHVAATEIPSGRLGGLHQHDARKWREFFLHYEPFYQQCTGAAQRLVAALNDIRLADLQGLPTRRQLYAQHRALSRALMDSELHNLRKRSATTMVRLQELANTINSNNNSSGIYNNGNNNNTNKLNSYCSLKSKGNLVGSYYGAANGGAGTLNRNKLMFSTSSSYSFNYQGNQNNKNNNNNNNSISHNVAGAPTTAITKSYQPLTSSSPSSTSSSLSSSTATNPKSCIYTATSSINPTTTSRLSATTASTISGLMNYCVGGGASGPSQPIASNIDVAIRLQKVTLLFNEIDRAAKRLEQLTEQRREHLRELTRQRALEDEINE
ncbi:probable serine/threonine-protein kinase nek3, partial [Musca vetustissima]|uniref:probable serine/threonine-protein kinase nek3 n=1 Tax=Musca vetustissima TaxID=27455 RepID=UPI002AB61DC9